MASSGSTNRFKAAIAAEDVPLFFVGWILLGLMTTSVYDAITSRIGKGYPALLAIFALSGLVLWGIFSLLGWIFRRRLARQSHVVLEKDKEAQAHRVLIVLVGPGQGRPHESAVEWHISPLNGPARLEHCWYVYTPEALANARAMEDHFRPNVRFHPVELASANDAPSAYLSVLEAIDQVSRAQITPPVGEDDVVVDITGGTKSMTAGAVLACRDRAVGMQYMLAAYTPGGTLKKGPGDKVESKAMKVDLNRVEGGTVDTEAEAQSNPAVVVTGA